jgi:hypothetical protein
MPLATEKRHACLPGRWEKTAAIQAAKLRIRQGTGLLVEIDIPEVRAEGCRLEASALNSV